MDLRFWVALATMAFAPLTAFAAGNCALDPTSAPDTPSFVDAIVTGPASEAEVLQQTRIAIQRTHAPMSPKYVALPRIDAVFTDNFGSHHTIAAVLGGPIPKAGEHVTLATRRRDPDEPCAFIPWTVVGKGTEV